MSEGSYDGAIRAGLIVTGSPKTITQKFIPRLSGVSSRAHEGGMRENLNARLAGRPPMGHCGGCSRVWVRRRRQRCGHARAARWMVLDERGYRAGSRGPVVRDKNRPSTTHEGATP